MRRICIEFVTKPAEARLQDEEEMMRLEIHQLKLVADKDAG